MIRLNSARPLKLLGVIGTLSLLLGIVAGCGTSTTVANTTPIKIGFTVSLTGDFSADGKAIEQGYFLWRDYINAHGGLLGRQVQLDPLDDASNPDQVTTDYQTLITVHKDDLVFGPFSTLLTKPASVVAHRYGYALLEGAGGGPSVFQQNLNNVFDVSLPVANNLAAYAQWILSLPASERPQSAFYATEDDPFTQPQVDIARQMLEAGGVKTVGGGEQVYAAETTDFTPIAQKVVQSGAQICVFGTLLPDITAFIQAMKQQHFNPQSIIATAGPDQGTQFLNNVGGTQTAEGIFVPNGWYAELNAPGNQAMVQAYVAKYGGTPDDISADVPEAYSVGQVLQQVVTQNNSLDNAKLIQTLHSGTFDSVQGKVKFDSTGQNTMATAYLFQWQSGKLIPVFPTNVATAQPEFPKPNWP
jgi:branched-chain amino acid transport system substrate-binding protein